jgi:hypothetical protein
VSAGPALLGALVPACLLLLLLRTNVLGSLDITSKHWCMCACLAVLRLALCCTHREAAARRARRNQPGAPGAPKRPSGGRTDDDTGEEIPVQLRLQWRLTNRVGRRMGTLRNEYSSGAQAEMLPDQCSQ